MYTVAICDDERMCVEENARLAAEILDDLGAEYRLARFEDAEHLYKALLAQPDAFQLLLLDVKLPAQSGMELAHMLRACAVNVGIIFISAYDDFVLEGYEVRAVQYLLKPVDKQKLRAAITWDYEQYGGTRKLIVRTEDGTRTVHAGDILYVDSFYRNVTIHLVGGETLRFYGTLTAIKEELPQGTFAFCHKSYCVNLDYVLQFKRYEVLLAEGITVPASKGQYDQFKLAFLRH